MPVEKSILNNDLTVMSDYIHDFGTVSVGLFVKVGSVNETEELNGVSHFIEHMAFKGTKSRKALEIAEAIESVGGYMNAYTSKEVTAFYAKVLKEDLNLAVDIIADIVQNSTFDKQEFETERGVIQQEIKQYNDSPDDLAFEVFQNKCFEKEALGRPILGPSSNIASFSPSDLKQYQQANYSADKMILVGAGYVDHSNLVDLANTFCKDMKPFKTETPKVQKYQGGFAFKEKDLEQRHLVFGFEGLPHSSKNKYNLSVLSTLLGGGMSSRLFQEVREKRGLVYSIFSFCSNYQDTGVFGIYAGCEIDKAQEVLKVEQETLRASLQNISEEEVEKAKKQIKASLLMGLESSSTRMERVANQILLQGEYHDVEHIIALVDEVNVPSVKNVLKQLLDTTPTLAVVGNAKNIETLRDEVFK